GFGCSLRCCVPGQESCGCSRAESMPEHEQPEADRAPGASAGFGSSANFPASQVEENIFQAKRCNREAHRFVKTNDSLQGPEKICGASYEQPHQSLAAFDAGNSA